MRVIVVERMLLLHVCLVCQMHLRNIVPVVMTVVLFYRHLIHHSKLLLQHKLVITYRTWLQLSIQTVNGT